MKLGSGEANMLARIMDAAAGKPSSTFQVMTTFMRYMQVRHFGQLFDVYDPSLAEKARPFAQVH